MPVKVKEIDRLEKMYGSDPDAAKRSRQAQRAISTLLEVWSIDTARRKGDIETLLHNQTRWQWPITKYTKAELITRSRELGEWLRARRQNEAPL